MLTSSCKGNRASSSASSAILVLSFHRFLRRRLRHCQQRLRRQQQAPHQARSFSAPSRLRPRSSRRTAPTATSPRTSTPSVQLRLATQASTQLRLGLQKPALPRFPPTFFASSCPARLSPSRFLTCERFIAAPPVTRLNTSPAMTSGCGGVRQLSQAASASRSTRTSRLLCLVA